jgi:hypothetical protein
MTDMDAQRLVWQLATQAAAIDITIGEILELPPAVLADAWISAAALHLHLAHDRLEQALYESANFSAEKILARRERERNS